MTAKGILVRSFLSSLRAVSSRSSKIAQVPLANHGKQQQQHLHTHKPGDEAASAVVGSGRFEVTAEMVESFNTAGYIVARQLLTEAEVAHLRRAIDEPEGVASHRYDRAAGEGITMSLWNHPGSDVTGVFARMHRVAGTMEKLLGGHELYHYHSFLMMKEPEVGGPFLWHQDYGYFYYNGCLFPEMGTVFLAVDECRKENGCLQVAPGTHRMGRVDHAQVGEQLQPHEERMRKILELCPPQFVEMSPGDVLFFHCNLLHCSSPNRSSDRRYGLLTAYNKRRNDPVKRHHHPQYTPLDRLPDEALLACTNFTDLSGKDFKKPDMKGYYPNGKYKLIK